MGEQEQKPKQVVEWSFSFGDVGESVNKMLHDMGVEAEVKTAHFAESVGGATSAKVRLDLSTGKMIVHALPTADNLIEADLRYIGEVEFNASGEAEKTVRLGQKTIPSVIAPFKDFLSAVANHDDLRWEISLSQYVPLELDIHGGVGSTRLDLGSIQLKRLKIDGGVGETQLTLPSSSAPYQVDIGGGVGELNITAAEGAAFRMDVNGGVGGMKIRLPENAAARIEVKGGVGGSKLSQRFNLVKGGNDFMGASGVWETSGFSLASQQIFIVFKGGVGGLKVS
jgi:hypothetical protein